MIEVHLDEPLQLAQQLDQFLLSLPEYSPYQHSAWRRAVAQAYGYTSGVVVYKDQAQILGFIAFSLVKNPLGQVKAVSLPYCDMGGVVATSAPVADALLEAFRHQVSVKMARGAELRSSSPALAGTELAHQKVRMVLDLPDSSTALLASYVPKLRSQIKKAEKNGLTTQILTHADVAAFYQVYAANMHRLGSPAHPQHWFEAVAAHYAAADALLICLVYLDQQVIGAGFVLRVGSKAVIPWASTLAQYNSLAPNMLLYWTIQSWLADHGIRQFDFGRSTFGEGTYKFKKQWGAEPVLLDWQQFDKQGNVEARAANATSPSRLRPLVEQLWSHMPASVMTWLGGSLRRYITL